MNETNEVSWITRLIVGMGVIGFLAILVCAMIAPLFGPWIERRKCCEYALYSDWERRVSDDMRVVYAFLWIIAIVSWIGFFVLYIKANT